MPVEIMLSREGALAVGAGERLEVAVTSQMRFQIIQPILGEELAAAGMRACRVLSNGSAAGARSRWSCSGAGCRC